MRDAMKIDTRTEQIEGSGKMRRHAGSLKRDARQVGETSIHGCCAAQAQEGVSPVVDGFTVRLVTEPIEALLGGGLRKMGFCDLKLTLHLQLLQERSRRRGKYSS